MSKKKEKKNLNCSFSSDGFEKFLKSLKTLKSIEEIPLLFREDGLHIKASDEAVVMVGKIFLAKENFTEYKVSDEIKIGVENSELQKLLGKFDEPTLEANGGGLLKIKEGNKYFELPLIEIDRDSPSTDELEYNEIIEMDSKKLSKDIDNCSQITDNIEFTIDEKGFFISAEKDNKKYRNKLKDKTSDKKIKSKYSIDYLKPITRQLGEIKVFLKSDYPIKITEICDNHEITIIIAPRVDD